MHKAVLQNNIKLLHLVTDHLQELTKEVTFVGGCITGLLLTDEFSPDARYTEDVDCIVNVVTISAYLNFSNKLRKKQLKELPPGEHPICRWQCENVLVDVMPIDENVLGFSNKWYKDAHLNAKQADIGSDRKINVISAPYFIATKLEAFKNRGNKDYLSSHDFEDIVSILDGRPEIIDDIANAPDNLRQYLCEQFDSIIQDQHFTRALPGHLNYSAESHERKTIVENRIKSIVNLL